MFGCVGDDAHGQELIDNLAKNGVKTGDLRKLSGEFLQDWRSSQ